MNVEQVTSRTLSLGIFYLLDDGKFRSSWVQNSPCNAACLVASLKGAFAWLSLRRKWGVVLNIFSGKTIWVMGLGFHIFSSRILPQPRIDLRISTLRIRLLPRNIMTRSGFEHSYDLSIGLCRRYFRSGFGFVSFCKVMMLNIDIYEVHKNLKTAVLMTSPSSLCALNMAVLAHK
jgi:hypothetical protein